MIKQNLQTRKKRKVKRLKDNEEASEVKMIVADSTDSTVNDIGKHSCCIANCDFRWKR